MAVTFSKQLRIGETIRLAWSSDKQTPTYQVYLWGELYAITASSFLDVHVNSGENVIVEVLDNDHEVPTKIYPPWVTLRWFESASQDVNYYLIEEFVASVWTERKKVYDEGQGYFTWRSRQLEDETTHQFRITPIGVNGNAGTASIHSYFMVRNPDPPLYGFAAGLGFLIVVAA